jgi:nucleoside-diphosphate-sugar epimerase
MKILVTGGAGFIGSHLVDRLVADDWGEVVILDNLFRGRLSNIEHHRGNPRVQFCEGDIRDYPTVLDAARGAELIFHLAAQSNVMGAVTDVDYSFTTNVVGTYHVLKAAKASGVRRMMFTSSREAYGEARYLPVDEDHPLGSKNTYGASKVAGEMYCRVFSGNFGLETAVLRLSNVYGARDYGRVIPLWLERANRGENLIVYGGEQLIDFVWVAQVVEALLRASSANIVGQPVNVGSGQGTPILSLAERILQLIPTASRLDRLPARAVEVAKFTARVDRMRELLGLEPPADPLFGLPELVTEYR